MSPDATGQSEIVPVVCLWDPAIEWPPTFDESRKIAVAYQTDRDLSVLTFKGRPTRFLTRRLRRSEMRDVRCMSTEPYQHESAFASGVTAVEMPDGSMKRPASGRWTQEELDAFDDATVNEIGSVVFQMSRLPFGLKVIYAPPPSSGAALAASLFLSVAPSPKDAASSKSAPAAQSEAEAPTRQPSAPSGE